jgi:hypothetical protein
VCGFGFVFNDAFSRKGKKKISLVLTGVDTPGKKKKKKSGGEGGRGGRGVVRNVPELSAQE